MALKEVPLEMGLDEADVMHRIEKAFNKPEGWYEARVVVKDSGCWEFAGADTKPVLFISKVQKPRPYSVPQVLARAKMGMLGGIQNVASDITEVDETPRIFIGKMTCGNKNCVRPAHCEPQAKKQQGEEVGKSNRKRRSFRTDEEIHEELTRRNTAKKHTSRNLITDPEERRKMWEKLEGGV